MKKPRQVTTEIVFVCVLLAAGMATRLGEPKPLLDWFGDELVNTQVKNLKQAGIAQIYLVTGHQHELVTAKLKDHNINIIHNTEYKTGKLSSLKIGVESVAPDATAMMILAVDQPRPTKLLASLIEAHENQTEPITVPYFDGRGGHPIIVDATLRDEIMNLTDAELGLRGLLKKHAQDIQKVVFDNPTIHLDINDSTDYQFARENYSLWNR